MDQPFSSEWTLPLSAQLGIWQKVGAPCFLNEWMKEWMKEWMNGWVSHSISDVNISAITVEPRVYSLCPLVPKPQLVNQQLLSLILPAKWSHGDPSIYFLVDEGPGHGGRKRCFPGWDILETTLLSKFILKH